MITISFSIALIAIVFGAKLLAQSQKDNLGALYKYLSWFIIVMGFLVLMCDGAQGFLKMCHRGEGRMMNKEYMMMGRGENDMMGGCPMWMMHHHNMCNGNNDCNGMMNCQDGGNCSMHDGCNGMMNCKDDGKDGGSCHEGGGMSGGSCPMMGNMKGKMDTAKARK